MFVTTPRTWPTTAADDRDEIYMLAQHGVTFVDRILRDLEQRPLEPLDLKARLTEVKWGCERAAHVAARNGARPKQRGRPV